MASDFVPSSDVQFDPWIDNFVTQLSARAVTLGFTPMEVTALQSAASAWKAALIGRRTAADSAKAAVESKRGKRQPLVDLARSYAKRLQAHPAMTDEFRRQFRMTVPAVQRTIVNAPGDSPQLRLNFGTRGRIMVHFGPNPSNERRNGLPKGATGAVIQVAEGGVPTGAAGWTHLAIASSSPFTHQIEFAAQSPAARVLSYRCAYVTRKGEQGPWSAPVVGTATP